MCWREFDGKGEVVVKPHSQVGQNRASHGLDGGSKLQDSERVPDYIFCATE